MGQASEERKDGTEIYDVVGRDCVGLECSFSDTRDSMPTQTTSLIAEKAEAWFIKDYDDEWPLRILTCRVSGPTEKLPFTKSVVDRVSPKDKLQYTTIWNSEAGGSNVSVSSPTRFIAQTPKDGGPFCSFCLTTTNWGRGLVSGIYHFDNQVYDCSSFLKSGALSSGWRANGWQIQVLPVAFLAAHVSNQGREITSLSKRISLLEDVITDPNNQDDLNLDFGALTRRLHECHTELFRLERRAHFESGMAKNIDTMLTAAEKDRAGWLHMVRVPLELSRNIMDAQSYDLQSIPKRIESQRVLIFNLILQRDARMNIQIGRTNMEIADTSRRIAEASMRDSASMKTIAILTMVFLPGTAVASFFSMTMFNWGIKEGSLASSYIWIYFVTSIPLTAAVLGVWYLSIRRRRAARQSKFVLSSPPTLNSNTMRTDSAFDREAVIGAKRE